jgi:choline dehydrogenase
LEDFVQAVKLTLEVLEQASLTPFRGARLAPAPAVQSDQEIAAWVRATTESAYHPCGTCKMGTDESSVVDPRCRVHGIDGLHVVDASIMPDEVSGNLNAPTIMMAEKASDLLLGRTPLPASDVPVFEAPDWRHAQR